jgi:hypothetical protein
MIRRIPMGYDTSFNNPTRYRLSYTDALNILNYQTYHLKTIKSQYEI